MVDKITPRMIEWSKSDSAQTVILKATGNRALCAGGDVTSLATAIREKQSEGAAEATAFFRDEYQLNHLIASYPKPYISIMNGITMGGGVGLSVHAPFRIATENTVFAMPETDIGFFPDVGGTFFLPRLDGQIGSYLALTSQRLKGYDVVSAGIATHYVPESLLPELEARLCEIFVDKDLETVDIFSLVNDAIEDFATDAPEGYNYLLSGANREAIDAAFSQPTVEEIIRSLEASEAPIAKDAVKKINERSPTSVKVTFEALKRGKTLDITSALAAEYRLAERFMYGTEFAEGVTAKLIRKEAPKWNPPELSAVTPSIVNEYLTPIPDSKNPDIEFIDPSVSFVEYPHNFGLPTEKEVREYITGEDSSDREFKVNKEEVIAHFDNKTKSKLGVRRKIEEILARKTKPDPSDPTLLDWIE